MSAEASNLGEPSYMAASHHGPHDGASLLGRPAPASLHYGHSSGGVPAPSFATVVFVREDCDLRDVGYHVATMRVPLPSGGGCDMTVRELAKESMRRLVAKLRAAQKFAGREVAAGSGPGTTPLAAEALPFQGVAQILVEDQAHVMGWLSACVHEGDEVLGNGTARSTERDDDHSSSGGSSSGCVSHNTTGVASPLPSAEVFAGDRVHHVVAVSREFVVMRLRPTDAARRPPRTRPVAPAAAAAAPAAPAGESLKRPRKRSESPPAEKSSVSSGDADFSSSDEDDDDQALRHATLADTDVDMVARELRERGKNRLGWGPDAHKNFGSNYVSSPHKLMTKRAKPKPRPKKAARVSPPAERPATPPRKVSTTPARKRTPAPRAGKSAPQSQSQSASPAPSDPNVALLPPTPPVVEAAPEPVTEPKPVLQTLDITRPMRPATATAAAVAPAPTKMAASISISQACEMRGRQLANAATPASSHGHAGGPTITAPAAADEQTPPQHISHRGNHGALGNLWPLPSSATPVESTARQLRWGDEGGDATPSAVSAPLPAACTPQTQPRPTHKGSPFSLRAMRPTDGGPPSQMALPEPQGDRAPKAWSEQGLKWFDPDSYVGNLERAGARSRSPIRARRQVELPPYFKYLDSGLSASEIIRRVSQDALSQPRSQSQ